MRRWFLPILFFLCLQAPAHASPILYQFAFTQAPAPGLLGIVVLDSSVFTAGNISFRVQCLSTRCSTPYPASVLRLSIGTSPMLRNASVEANLTLNTDGTLAGSLNAVMEQDTWTIAGAGRNWSGTVAGALCRCRGTVQGYWQGGPVPPATVAQLVGRTQGTANIANGPLSISPPLNVQSGDLLVAAVASKGAAAGPPPGWTSVGSCTNSVGETVAGFVKTYSTNDAVPYIFSNVSFAKAILRVFRGPVVADAQALGCSNGAANSFSLAALTGTTTANEPYAGFFFLDNTYTSVIGPSDLADPEADRVQWSSFDGDKLIPTVGTAPGAETVLSGNPFRFNTSLNRKGNLKLSPSFSKIIIDQNPGDNDTGIKMLAAIAGGANLDAVEADAQGGGLWWYRAPSNISTGSWTRCTIVGNGTSFYEDGMPLDLFGDGVPGIVISNLSSHQLQFYRNPRRTGADPCTNSWPMTVIRSDDGAHALITADFDGDGKPDFAMAESGIIGGSGAISFQNSPTSWTTVPLPSGWGASIALLDIGSGKGAINLLGADGNNIVWLENPRETGGNARTGTWIEHVIASFGAANGASFASGVFSSSGRMDGLMASNEDESSIGIYRLIAPANRRTGTWVMQTVASDYQDVHKMVTADFDGDGCLDFVVGEQEQAPNRRVAVFSGDCSGNFTQTVLETTGGMDEFVADANGDGKLDFIISNHGFFGAANPVELWLNGASPTASLTAAPSRINQGGSSTLTWSSTNAASCTGTNFDPNNATSGSVSVSPIATTTYSVNCSGATATATVTVASPRTLTVGAGKQYALPSQAFAAAADGDTVQIFSGTYTNDFVTIPANNLTITGMGTQPVITQSSCSVTNPNQKALWVVDGNNTTIQNLAFTNSCLSAALGSNGAGLRLEGGDVTIQNCLFANNQDGILTGVNTGANITISNSEFSNNGDGSGSTHNVYISTGTNSLTFTGNYSHNAKIGHLLKTRANINTIEYNRIMDTASGTASFEINVPQGGETYIIGNVIEKGPNSANATATMITFADESASNPTQALYVVNNTFVNDSPYTGAFIALGSTPTNGFVQNNIFVGSGSIAGASSGGSGTITVKNNLAAPNDPGFVNKAGYDYHLTATSAAIDAGQNPGSSFDGVSLTPTLQYVYDLNTQPRTTQGAAIDDGAFEFTNSGPFSNSNWVGLAITIGKDTITGASISCGNNCQFIAGTASNIGTVSASLHSGRVWAGSETLRGSGVDNQSHACSAITGFSIPSGTLHQNGNPAAGNYYECAVFNDTGGQGVANTGFVQGFTIAGTSAAAPTASLSANPTVIVAGGSSTLSWSSTNANSCIGSGFSTNNQATGSALVSPGTTTTYSVTCTGAGGSASANATVTVNSGGGGTGPCDSAAQAGTPCSLAYSLNRSMSSSYSGPLFRVLREDNGASADIGTVGGWVDTGTLDSFCSGTTCDFSTVYNQGSQCGHGMDMLDHITGAYPASYLHRAQVMEITLGSGKKMVYFGPGWLMIGSRTGIGSDCGMPTGSNPITVLMINGPTADNAQCCYDFGAAGPPLADGSYHDYGTGTMFAIDVSFMSCCNSLNSDSEDGTGISIGAVSRPFVAEQKTNGAASGALVSMKGGTIGQALAYGSTNSTTGGAHDGVTANNVPGAWWSHDGYNFLGALTVGMGGDTAGWAGCSYGGTGSTQNGAGGGTCGAFTEGLIVESQTSDATDNAIMNNINSNYQ